MRDSSIILVFLVALIIGFFIGELINNDNTYLDCVKLEKTVLNGKPFGCREIK